MVPWSKGRQGTVLGDLNIALRGGGGGVGTRPWWLALLACGGAYWPFAFEPSAMTSRHPYYCGHPHQGGGGRGTDARRRREGRGLEKWAAVLGPLFCVTTDVGAKGKHKFWLNTIFLRHPPPPPTTTTNLYSK